MMEVLRALDQARQRHTMNTPWTMAVALSIVFAALMLLVIGRTWQGPQALLWVAALLFACCAAGIALRETRMLRRYEIRLGERLEQSGLVERIALGHSQLPDIHRHTPWPWRLFLGGRPQRLAGWVKLIAYNVEWYLSEPRALIRPQWLAYALLILMAVANVVLVLLDTAGALVPGAAYLHGLFRLSAMSTLGLIIPVSWIANHFQARQGIAARLLHDVLRRRLTG